MQRKIAEKWAKDLPDYMQADVWYPHTTLLQDMQADLGKIAQHLEENFEPFCGEVQTIEFSRVEKVGYTIVDLMQNPLNTSISEVISTYVYKIGMISNQYSLSAAVNLFNTVINFVLLILVNGFSKKLGDTSLW